MSFVSYYTHSLDSKNRVFIPAKYREELGREFYITRKFDVFLSVYSAEDWEAYSEKISSLPEADAGILQDHILGFAQKCVPDSQGRIVLEDRLIKYANIDKNMVFVGSGKQIRIFSEEAWIERESNRDYDEVRAIMSRYQL